MNKIKNLNIKLNVNNSLPNLKNFINEGKIDFSIKNILKKKKKIIKKKKIKKKKN